jgi:hypothetical protein
MLPLILAQCQLKNFNIWKKRLRRQCKKDASALRDFHKRDFVAERKHSRNIVFIRGC